MLLVLVLLNSIHCTTIWIFVTHIRSYASYWVMRSLVPCQRSSDFHFSFNFYLWLVYEWFSDVWHDFSGQLSIRCKNSTNGFPFWNKRLYTILAIRTNFLLNCKISLENRKQKHRFKQIKSKVNVADLLQLLL